jgi:hydroxyacylglutathione hydrolase
MIIEAMTVSMFATNCYLVACPETREAVIIDPGADGKGIIDRAEKMQLEVKYIINTHGHIDHIGANGKLKEALKVPVLLNEKDLELYNNPGFGLGLVLRRQPAPDRYISEGDLIIFGKQTFKVIETPGHTAGGICLLQGLTLFCGDTLFAGSIGRTDLPGGSHDTLMESIHKKLMPLPEETAVYPGHGPATTIGREAAGNPFIAGSYL